MRPSLESKKLFSGSDVQEHAGTCVTKYLDAASHVYDDTKQQLYSVSHLAKQNTFLGSVLALSRAKYQREEISLFIKKIKKIFASLEQETANYPDLKAKEVISSYSKKKKQFIEDKEREIQEIENRGVSRPNYTIFFVLIIILLMLSSSLAGGTSRNPSSSNFFGLLSVFFFFSIFAASPIGNAISDGVYDRRWHNFKKHLAKQRELKEQTAADIEARAAAEAQKQKEAALQRCK